MSDADKSAITLTHPQAVARLKDVFDELERLRAKDTLTPEDERAFAELTVEFDETDEYRKRLEREAEYARISGVRERLRNGTAILERPAGHTADGYDRDAILEPDSIEDNRFKDPWNLSELRMYGESPEAQAQELRSRALSAIEKMPGTKDSVREGATKILEEHDDEQGTLARQCLLTSSPAYLRGWAKVAKSKGQTSLLTPEEQRALDAARAMSLTTTAGGFLIPFQLDPTVIITSDGSRNDIRQIARTVVATSNKWNGVSAGATSWSFDAEAAEVSDDTSTFAQPAIDIYTARGFVPISLEARMDEANVTAEVARLLAFGKDTLEATQFATGTGSAPQGIVTALTGTASEINAATDDTFARADVDTLQGSLPARYRSNAAWLANNLIYNKIRAFDTSGGSAFWANMNDGRPANLLGRPVYEAEGMDGTITTSGAVSNFVLIFGDFDNFVIADRIGMTVDFVPHLFHTSNNRPSGQSGWLAYYRVGSDSVNDGAFRLLDVPSAA